MRVLFATSEATPFVKTGGLADVCGELPICLAKKGVDVSVVLPLYSSIPQKFRKDFEFVKHFDIYLGNGKQYAGIFKYIYKGVTFYFIDNEKYFARPNVYGYDDEGERFAFYDFAFIAYLFNGWFNLHFYYTIPFLIFSFALLFRTPGYAALSKVVYRHFYGYLITGQYSYIIHSELS